MARSRSVASGGDAAGLAEVEAFYRRVLTAPVVAEALPWEPVRIGPTWQRDGDRWLLPEHSLGWSMLAWSGLKLQAGRDEPWVWTPEQARFLLWWYATDDVGRFLYRDGVLQRLKGWGKDPLGAGISLFELVGPCVVTDVVAGDPVGSPHVDPWVQVAAVSLEQTKNTMRLLPGFVTPEAKAEYRLQVGKESAYSGNRFLQAVTSSPSTLQGARSTFVLLNETHEWVPANGGEEMARVLSNNSTKSKGGAARTLRITNAYMPGSESVAEADRDAFDAVQAGRAEDTGLLYDSLEAAPEAPLSLEAAPAVVRSVRGDSTWLDIDRIVQSIADVRNPPSQSRRFWYNQIVAAEDAWLSPQDVDRIARPGLELVDGDRIVMFFDGSKSDDASGLVACRLEDGALFQLGVWQKPAGFNDRFGGWVVDRADVDLVVSNAFSRFKVVAFWADPSHAKDDESERFWDGLIDEWHRRYKSRLRLWAAKSGDRAHSIAWDMAAASRQAEFVPAAERFVADVEAGLVVFDGSAALRQHLKNARRRPGKHGVGLGKEHRESAKKVDLAVCAVGARMLWRAWANKRGAHTVTRVTILQ